MAKVIAILAEGFEEIEAVTFIDLLRRADIKCTLLGLSSVNVTGAHGITIAAEQLLSSFNDTYDGIILPGGGPGTENLCNSELVIEKIQDAFKGGLLCAAVCAAPAVLGKAGILKGKRVTCYPGIEPRLEGALVNDLAVVRDGTIITSRGVGTSISFALEIISFLLDRSTAEKIAEQILYKQ
ncbi:MAG: DJ-1/PfpI family protein [Chitinispirillaceae bacterium]|nr:DJ-1/PfpI family protein [Chitinispirillaceae bacterium]